MTRNQHSFHHPCTKRIGGYVAVAKAHHQHLAVRRQHPPDAQRKHPGKQFPFARIAPGQIVAFHGDVLASAPPQYFGGAFIFDADARVRYPADLMRAHSHAFEPSGVLIQTFHRQIRTKTAHSPHPFCAKQNRACD